MSRLNGQIQKIPLRVKSSKNDDARVYSGFTALGTRRGLLLLMLCSVVCVITCV